MENQVNEKLYGDKNTRLFLYWTVRVLIFDFSASTSHVYIYYFFFESVFFFNHGYRMMHIKAQVATICCALALFKLNNILRWVQLSPLIPSMMVTNMHSSSMFGRYSTTFQLITLLNNSNFWIDIYDHIICTFFLKKNSE